jgi:hypothetical protein
MERAAAFPIFNRTRPWYYPGKPVPNWGLMDACNRGDNMSEMDVVEAFLSQESAERAPLATDGERLCINAEVIAEWSEEGLLVTPLKQSPLHEQLKDRLVHTVLLRMADQQPACAGRRMTSSVGA